MNWLTVWIIAAGGIILTGCITHEETVYRDVDRVKIDFSNDSAARTFYETLSAHPSHRSKTESRTEVSIPVVFDHKQKVVDGPNRDFNRAVAECDTNKDGIISEHEAQIFAEQRHKR
jgi:hypothetical protein